MNRRTFLVSGAAIAAATVVYGRDPLQAGYPDRIHADNPDHRDYLVYMDGKLLHGCYEADRVQGWAKCFVQENGTNFVLAPTKIPPQELTLRGTVTFGHG